MSRSLSAQPLAQERPSLADVCGKPVKADLRPHQAAPRVRDVAAASVETSGKTHKEAAGDVDLDRSRFSHKLKDGSLTLKQLEDLGPRFAAEFGRQLVENYGALSSPQARMRETIRELRRRVDEVEQFVEFLK